MVERLTEELWASIEDIWKAILEHPFMRELTSGELDRDVFRFYIVQDALYLVDYARALALCGARASDTDGILLFTKNAASAIEVERALHDEFFSEFELSSDEVRSTPMAPTNRAYTSYLLSACYGGSFAECLGAILPCFWIYREVGRALLAKGSPDPLCQRWIDTYGGDEYGEGVEQVLRMTDRIGAEIGTAERARMIEHFVQTSRYEWMFWDMGHRMEAWPVGG
ncbi:MAG: thiaminase II [Gaiellales bacterium]